MVDEKKKPNPKGGQKIPDNLPAPKPKETKRPKDGEPVERFG